jgi:hypothetical protein
VTSEYAVTIERGAVSVQDCYGRARKLSPLAILADLRRYLIEGEQPKTEAEAVQALAVALQVCGGGIHA